MVSLKRRFLKLPTKNDTKKRDGVVAIPNTNIIIPPHNALAELAAVIAKK